jgi:hypothetical protein
MKKDLIYLSQTDTTVGFLSQNYKKINIAKERYENQKVLKALPSLKILKQNIRVPSIHKKRVRRSKSTTFIYSNKKESFRIINSNHKEFIKKFGFMYSSSANLHQKTFSKKEAIKRADIIVFNKNEYIETPPSEIYLLSKEKIRKIR